MKHQWRIQEKKIYQPKTKPEIIHVPKFKFFVIHGEGNPNADKFAEHIAVLYALSYAIKMNLKKENNFSNYMDYTVYPLEGVWDINDEAKKTYNGVLDKDTLVYDLMIRQPDFLSTEYVDKIVKETKLKKPNPLIDEIKFLEIEEGPCIQMLHLGSYDNEPDSFRQMEAFADEHDLKRKSLLHREIYLSDARKVAAEKLKTVLRFKTLAKK